MKMDPTLAWLIPLFAGGALLGLSIGFAIAGLTRTTESAASFASLLVMPLWILSGVMFPVESFPSGPSTTCRPLPLFPLGFLGRPDPPSDGRRGPGRCSWGRNAYHRRGNRGIRSPNP